MEDQSYTSLGLIFCPGYADAVSRNVLKSTPSDFLLTLWTIPEVSIHHSTGELKRSDLACLVTRHK